MPQSVVTCLAMNCFGSQSPSKWKDREFSVRSRCFKFTGGKCIWPKDVAAQAWCEDTGSRSRGAQHVDVHLAVDACPVPAFYVDNPQCCRRPPSQPPLRSAGRDRDGTVCPARPRACPQRLRSAPESACHLPCPALWGDAAGFRPPPRQTPPPPRSASVTVTSSCSVK